MSTCPRCENWEFFVEWDEIDNQEYFICSNCGYTTIGDEEKT